MRVTKFKRFWFKRCIVTFEDFFTQEQLVKLHSMINAKEWMQTQQEFRYALSGEPWDFIEFEIPKIIKQWTGEDVEFKDWWFWRDTPGLEYEPHTDRGTAEPHEHHVQIFLNDGSAELGAVIHPFLIRWVKLFQVPYKYNAGYYMNTAQTIFHSVPKVPLGQERISCRIRYRATSP